MAGLMADVRHYFGLGVHRTGTAVDYATSDWLESRFAAAGLTTRRQSWAIRQYFLEDAAVEIGAKRLEAFPVWYSPPMPEGLDGLLVNVDDEETQGDSLIAFVDAARDRAWWDAFESASFGHGRFKAVLAVSPDPTGQGEIVAQNVRPTDVGTDLPIPVLYVRADDLENYRQAVSTRAPVKLVLRASAKDGTAGHNVLGAMERSDRWIIVSTPSSGWFQCAGERGPGIALTLGLAEWAAGADRSASYLFTANSGHELGFWGAKEQQQSGAMPAPENTIAWLHLGASIATPDWRDQGGTFQPDDEISRGNLQMTDERFRPVLEQAFSHLRVLSPRVFDRPVGELANVADHGYAGFGLVGGGNVFFHTRKDTPATVSEKSLAAVFEGLKSALGSLEKDW